MSMPPLANLFAIYHENPVLLREISLDMESSNAFEEVWQPFPGWIAGVKYLPKSDPDSELVKKHGFAFVEGRDVILDQSKKDPQDRIREIIDCVDSAPENLVRFSGDFGFVRFMPHGAATVVRSCGGLVPFYLWQADGCVAISTQLASFVRYLPVEFELDPLVNAVWCTGDAFFPDNRTFLKGVSILGRGCFARIKERELKLGQYWNPRPKKLEYPSETKQKEHVDRLRTLLIHKLERDLDPADGNLLTLSGGVDSSCLAALAAGVVGRKVWTWSLLPAPDELFAHEMSYIQPLIDKFGFERTWTVLFKKNTRIELLQNAPRVLLPVLHPALCDLSRVSHEANINVLFGGELADETCGSVFTLPDWIAHTSLFRLVTEMNRLPLGPSDILRWGKHRVLSMMGEQKLPFMDNLQDFIRQEIKEEYASWLDQRRFRARNDPYPLKWLSLRSESDGFVVMNWEVSSSLDIRRSFPFFNREILDLAFECHPCEFVGPGTKKILRTALCKDVPEKNLFRPDKGHWGSGIKDEVVTWKNPLPGMLRAVIKDEWFSIPSKKLGSLEAFFLMQLARFAENFLEFRTRKKER